MRRAVARRGMKVKCATGWGVGGERGAGGGGGAGELRERGGGVVGGGGVRLVLLNYLQVSAIEELAEDSAGRL